jgi:hypothetical protein
MRARIDKYAPAAPAVGSQPARRTQSSIVCGALEEVKP